VTLLLREDDIGTLLPMREAVHCVREALSSQRRNGGQNLPRRRLDLDRGVFNVMAASVPAMRSDGLKAYTVTHGGARFMVALWDHADGRLLALIEADLMGRIRTGAASGVATDALAAPSASRLAVIGSGNQAWTQVEAITHVRQIQSIKVFSRTREHREQFAARISDRLGIPATPAESVEAAVRTADILVTITNSRDPVVDGAMLPINCHINATGCNYANRRELSSSVFARAQRIVVDSIEQANIEAGDLLIPINEGALSWNQVEELGDVLAHPIEYGPGITVFKSLGIAVEDVAVARHVFDQAIERGVGEYTTFGELS
jgi:alanine dehydrogenase